MLEESSDRETTDVTSAKSNSSLKSLLKSKGCEIKGKNGANYQRHGSFCINSLGLPAEDIGVSNQNVPLWPCDTGESTAHFRILSFYRKTFTTIFSYPATIMYIGSYTNLE